MLQSVRLINYRGLKDTTIPLAPITLLTGMNGIGKTSVLEGLYFLLVQPVPDVVVFPRYQQFWQIQGNMTASGGLSPITTPVRSYDYPAFWKECLTSGSSKCQIVAAGKDYELSWEAKISDFAELGRDPELKTIATAYGLQSGIGVPYVLWEWNYIGNEEEGNRDGKHRSKAFQQLAMEPRFSPRVGDSAATVCRYVDMPSLRYIPNKLPLQTEKLLTRALNIIKEGVTGVRLDGIPPCLRIIINDELDYTLGTLGGGAETWASTLLVLSELASIDTEYNSIMFLADEIGAGIHYSKLPEMWDFLSKFLSQHPHIQVVLTTHSQDCVNAFCKTFQNEKPGTAQIVRMHKFDEKDGVQTTAYSHETFASILSGDWEVRG